MARTPGLNQASYNFEVQYGAPFDARMKCPTKADLYGADGTDMSNAYVGMVASVTNDPTPENNGFYILVDLSGGNVESSWKKIDGRITGFAVIDNPTDGDFADQGNQIIRITQSNGSSEADTFFDILTSGFAGGGGFRFLGLATDHANPVPSDLGFLENETSYDFLAGDVFRIKNSGSTDGLYYVPADVTLASQSYVLWSTTWTNAIAAGEIVLFHEDVEPGNQLYNSSVPSGTVTVEDHGGIPANTDVDTLSNGTNTLSDILDQILFPAICPTAPSGVPSISFTSSPADNSLFVIGETVDIDFTTGAANLGLWNTADGSSQVYQGDITSSTLTGPNALNQSLTVTNNNPENPSVTGHTIVAGSGAGNTWTLTTIFAAGTDPVDNFGETCTGLAPGSTTKTSSIDFEGVYPVFRGTNVSYSQVGDTWTDGWTPTQLIASGNWAAISDLTQSNPVSDLITDVNNNLDSNGLFSFESTSTQTEGFPVEQAFSEGITGTPPRHRFAIPANISVGNIYGFAPGAGGGSWFVVNTWSTSTKTLLINGTSVTYTIYERSGTDAGATKFRVTFS
jgi:hypothetical protein